MNAIIFCLVSFGIVAVGLCFLFLMPLVGKTLVVLFSIFMGERTYAQMTKTPSGSVFIDPNEIKELQ